LSAPVTAIARTPTGNGYWILGIDGHVYALGDAHYYGNAALGSTSHAADIARRPTGDGYWVTADITPAG
ncbi:MAG TPA: hypothetical protein VN636_14185, partial [Acidimicrobiia bacterium]|nr:hypothetical protein [Acidimicrobiia bacterium]